jgi:hypothetical protein
MSASTVSPETLHAKEDTCNDDKETAGDMSASSSPLLSLPALGPPATACDVLQPLSEVSSQSSVPLPTSGMVAALARQKRQQQATASEISMQDDSPKLESGINPTMQPLDSAGILEGSKDTSDLPQDQSHSEAESRLRRTSSGSDSSLLDVRSFPTPSASISPDDIDQCPVFSRRYDDSKSLDRESVQKRRETVQLFHGKDEDSGIWSRRVVEYR